MWWTTTNVWVIPELAAAHTIQSKELLADGVDVEIGHEKAQSVIDSITSSYAAEGQAGSNPMLGQQPGPGQPFPPPPFGFPGEILQPGNI